MGIPKDNSLLNHARRLRREMTPQERRLWYGFLRRYPVKIYKQRINGRYIVDFYCASAKLVIEVDGSQHFEKTGQTKDQKRDRDLDALGLQVLRFSNRDVNLEFYAVCDLIDRTIRQRVPNAGELPEL